MRMLKNFYLQQMGFCLRSLDYSQSTTGIPPSAEHLAFCEGQDLVTHRVPAQQVIREPKSYGQLGLGGKGRPPLRAELQGKSLMRFASIDASTYRLESMTAKRV